MRALLRYTDLAATLLFAFEGAAVAADAGMDVFGVFVVGFATALGGGIIRDVLLGDTPPAALSTVDYTAVAVLGAGAVAVIYQWTSHVPTPTLRWLDAGGLALFAVTGATKAVEHKLNVVTATLLGTITGCGGGALRDILLNQVPIILRAHIYAVAAALGAAVTAGLLSTRRSRLVAMTAGAAACFALRMISVELDWNLPD